MQKRNEINSPEDFKNPLAPASYPQCAHIGRHYTGILPDAKEQGITYSRETWKTSSQIAGHFWGKSKSGKFSMTDAYNYIQSKLTDKNFGKLPKKYSNAIRDYIAKRDAV